MACVWTLSLNFLQSVRAIQRVTRGYLGRKVALATKEDAAKNAANELKELMEEKRRHDAATLIQSRLRRHLARDILKSRKQLARAEAMHEKAIAMRQKLDEGGATVEQIFAAAKAKGGAPEEIEARAAKALKKQSLMRAKLLQNVYRVRTY